MDITQREENNLSEADIMTAFNRFFIDDGYSFCLSDSRLKSIQTDHIEKTPELNWCQLKFSNCEPKSYNIQVSQQSSKKFIREVNKFNFKTLKELCRELKLEESGTKYSLKRRLGRLRIEHILTGKPILSIYKI
mgnify:CR=1 FL=1